jgi:hypothetical protein
MGGTTLLLRAEGMAYVVASLWGFHLIGESWWWFWAVILLPDIGFLGYVWGPRTGAITYNALHTTLGPLALAFAAMVTNNSLVLSMAAVWMVHIGIDRVLGYGLKSAMSFKDTHLGELGRTGRG